MTAISDPRPSFIGEEYTTGADTDLEATNSEDAKPRDTSREEEKSTSDNTAEKDPIDEPRAAREPTAGKTSGASKTPGASRSTTATQASDQIVAEQLYTAQDLVSMGLDEKIADYLISMSVTGGAGAMTGEELLDLETRGSLMVSKGDNGGDELSVVMQPNDGYSVLEIMASTDLTANEASSLVSSSGGGGVLGRAAYAELIDNQGKLTSEGLLVNGGTMGRYSAEQLVELGLSQPEADWLIAAHGKGSQISTSDLKMLIEIDADGQYALTADAKAEFVADPEAAEEVAIANSGPINADYLTDAELSEKDAQFILDTFSDGYGLTNSQLQSLIEAGVLVVTDADATPPALAIAKTETMSGADAKKAAEEYIGDDDVLAIKRDGSSKLVADTTGEYRPLALTERDARFLNDTYGGGDGLDQDELADALAAGVVQIVDGELMMTTGGKRAVNKDYGPTDGDATKKQIALLDEAMIKFDPNGSGTNRQMTLKDLMAAENGPTEAQAQYILDTFGDGTVVSYSELKEAIEDGSIKITSEEDPNDPDETMYRLELTDPDFEEPVDEAEEEKKEVPRTKEQEFYYKHREEFQTITEKWDDWNNGDSEVSREDLERIANDEDSSQAEKDAANMLLAEENDWLFDQLDSGRDKDGLDGKISTMDLTSWMEDKKIFDVERRENEEHFDVAEENWSDWATNDGEVTESGLESIASDDNKSREERNAAQYFLDNPDLLFHIDVFGGEEEKASGDELGGEAFDTITADTEGYEESEESEESDDKKKD